MDLQKEIQQIKTSTGHLYISFFNRQITDAEVKEIVNAITTNTKITSLTLYLNKNHITDQGIKALSALIKNTKLILLALYLNNNQITDEGIKILGMVIKNSNLTRLTIFLQNNKITSEGAKELYRKIEDTKLKFLNIGLDGTLGVIKALSKVMENKKLVYLTIHLYGDVVITAEDIMHLSKSIENTELDFLNMHFHQGKIIFQEVLYTEMMIMAHSIEKTATSIHLHDAFYKSWGTIKLIENTLALNENFEHRERQREKRQAKLQKENELKQLKETIKEQEKTIETLTKQSNDLNQEKQQINKTVINQTSIIITQQEKIDNLENSTAEYKKNESISQIAQQILTDTINNQTTKIKQLQTTIEKLKNSTNCSVTNNDQKSQLLEFQTKFKSDECFKIFKIRNVKICLDQTDTIIIPAEECNRYSGNQFCLSPKSWLVTSQNCMTDLHNYLTVCLRAFELKKFTPCNSLDEVQLISGDIKQTKIQYTITTSFSSYRCFEEFAKKHTKICWQNTDMQVISPDLLNQYTEDIYISVSPWEITRGGCIEKPNYFDICIEEFAKKDIVLCESDYNAAGKIFKGLEH